MRKIAAFFIAISLLVLCASGAAAAAASPAAGSVALAVDKASADKGVLSVYFSTNQRSVTAGMLSLTIGGTAVPISQVQRLSDTMSTGACYLILVDLSAATTPAKQTSVSDFLTAFINNMRDADSGAIIGNAAALPPAVFTYDKTALLGQITPALRPQQADLYKGMIAALNASASRVEPNKKIVMIVISNCVNVSPDSDKDAVLTQIGDDHIPLYSVSMLNATSTAAVTAASKNLSDFAAASQGGGSYSIRQGGSVKPADVAGNIQTSVNQSYVLTANFGQGTNGLQPLNLALTSADGKTAQSGFQVIIERTVAQVATPGADQPGGSDHSVSLWTILLAVIAFLAIAGGIVMYISLRRHGGEPDDAAEDESDDLPVIPVNEIDMPKNASVKTITPTSTTVHPLEDAGLSDPEADGSEPAVPTRKIVLTRLGKQPETFTLDIGEKFVIGRNPALTDLTFRTDELMSGKHCELSYDGKCVRIRDLNSTNGTYINGIPVMAYYAVRPDDVMLAGSMELRFVRV